MEYLYETLYMSCSFYYLYLYIYISLFRSATVVQSTVVPRNTALSTANADKYSIVLCVLWETAVDNLDMNMRQTLHNRDRMAYYYPCTPQSVMGQKLPKATLLSISYVYAGGALAKPATQFD